MTVTEFVDRVVFANIPGVNGTVSISTKLALKALVAKPEFYYHGIEAFDLAEINYWAKEYHIAPKTAAAHENKWNIAGLRQTVTNYIDFKATAEADYSRDYEEKVANDTIEMIPDFVATYHLNPSNATISTDPTRYAFIIENKEYTRAVDKANILKLNNIWKVEKINTDNQHNTQAKGTVGAGAINVYANFKTNLEWTKKQTELIQKIAEEDAVTVIALQYKDPSAWTTNATTNADSVVTSDYAALYAARYYNLRLNLIQKYWGYNGNDHRHLHNNALEAITSVWDEDFALNGVTIPGNGAFPGGIDNDNYRDTTRIVNIAWNNPGLDLDSIVNTHYDYWSRSTAYNDRAWDACAADGKLKKKGLVYSYELIGWYSGTNTTSESVHAALKDWVGNDKSVKEFRPHILRPQTPKYEANTSNGANAVGKYGPFEGAEWYVEANQPKWRQLRDVAGTLAEGSCAQNLSTVNREPLVRVTLTDTINNKKVKIGYIKFHIVKTDIPDEIITAEYTFTDAFNMKCGEPEFVHKLTWSQIEASILNQMTIKNPSFPGLSRSEFSKNYKLVANDYPELNAPAGYVWKYAKQFKDNRLNSEEVCSPNHYPWQNNNNVNETYFGEVKGGWDYAPGMNTPILEWHISYNQAYQWFCHPDIRQTAQNTERSVYVRFQKVGHNEMRADGEDRMRAIEQAENWVCIKLTWKPSPINNGPLQGSVKQDRLNEYWYHHNGEKTIRNLGEGADAPHEDIHINVQTIGQRDVYDPSILAECRFESNVLNTFYGNAREGYSARSPFTWKDYNTYKSLYDWSVDEANQVNPWWSVTDAPTGRVLPRWRNNFYREETEIYCTTENDHGLYENAYPATTDVTPGHIATTITDQNGFGGPLDPALQEFQEGISYVFDITTPYDEAISNGTKWGKSINDSYPTDVLREKIRGAHPRSLYTIAVGDRGAALYAKAGSRAGKVDDPRSYNTLTTDIKIAELVVKRNNTTNAIERVFVNWENNYWADDILNYQRHDSLADRQTFTTRIAQRVNLCRPHNVYDAVDLIGSKWYDNREKANLAGDAYSTDPLYLNYHAYVQRYDHSFYVQNSHFRVKVLRPINVDVKGVEFIDAETNGSSRKLDMKFTDWRDHDFTNDDYDAGTYWQYYGHLQTANDFTSGDFDAQDIMVFTNSAYITTDMHLVDGDDPLITWALYDDRYPNEAVLKTKTAEVTEDPSVADISFIWTAPTNVGDPADPNGPFGTLTYQNNRTTIGNFHAKIPVRIQYRWGYLWSYIIVSVKNTINNG